MLELPLFPLNTVLFPSTPLQLHIFEERYKKMIAHCRKAGSTFGVVLIQHGQEAHGPLPAPRTVGCTAQIAKVQPREQGKMDLVVLGQERFRILALQQDHPYLVGIVELIELNVDDAPKLTEQAKILRGWVERYLRVLGEGVEGLESALLMLPNEPLNLAYLAATSLQINLDQKQALLEIDNAPLLFNTLITTYRREIALAKKIMSTPTSPSESPFSRN